MPALDSRSKKTTRILAPIQECRCGTRIDVSRFEANQELTCPSCAGLFVVKGQPEPEDRAKSAAQMEADAAAAARKAKKKLITMVSAVSVVILTVAAIKVQKMRARDAVSPIPLASSEARLAEAAKLAEATRVAEAAKSVSEGAANAPRRAAAALIAEGVFKLKNRASNQVLDVFARNPGVDAQIKMFPSSASLNQRWIIRPLGSGFQLVAFHSMKALEVLGGAKDDAAPIRQGLLGTAPQQVWTFEPLGDGFHRVIANATGKALTVLDPSVASGGEVAQRPVSDSPAQQWKLEPLGGWPAELNPILEGRPLAAAPSPVRATQGAKPTSDKLVPISLSSVANCDSLTGSFSNPNSPQDTVRPLLSGWVDAAGIVFEVLKAETASSGKDLLILKGGTGRAKSLYPKRVEVPLNGAPLTKLHFLSGVGGWGYPWDKVTDKHLGVIAAQVTVVRKGGAQQVLLFRNGMEFADYHARIDVPGSAFVEGFAAHNRQVRYFSRPLSGTEPVEKLIIESFETNIAPVFVAITGEVTR